MMGIGDRIARADEMLQQIAQHLPPVPATVLQLTAKVVVPYRLLQFTAIDQPHDARRSRARL